MDYVLEMKGITIEFPGVKALDNVNFQLRPGEVHALVGENGAGKSTLMKVLMGIYTPESGSILLNGKEFQPKNPKDAQNNGISMIYQELNLVPDLTVAENVFIAREPRIFHNLLIDDNTMIKKTRELLDSLELDISPTEMVANLSAAEKQMVEIIKALVLESNILILDEPTSSLATHEVQKLFSIIKKLQRKGVSIIYISHRLEEFDFIVERVTVMRDGKYVATRDWSDITIPELISMMVGRSITELYPERHAKIGEIVLEAKNFCNDKLKDVSLYVRSGEILGLAGLMGAGRTEFVRAIFGADKITSGDLYLHGRKVSIKSPADAVKHNLAYLPEDRKKDGLMLDLEVNTNILAASLESCARCGIVNDKHCRKVVDQKIKELAIKTPSPNQIVKYLSGGNQQKVLISRWLCRDSQVVIFDEPTRGIDVGAKYEVYSLINKVAESGAAVIMISSEMSEILGMSDRIAVMFEGSMIGEVPAKEATQELILQMASNIVYRTEEDR